MCWECVGIRGVGVVGEELTWYVYIPLGGGKEVCNDLMKIPLF
jgi:hypothetical protein